MVIDEKVIIGTLFATLSSIFWYWMKNRDRRMEKIEVEQDRIKDGYQKREDARRDRDDARRDFEIINDSLKEIKRNVLKINDKLDQKADK